MTRLIVETEFLFGLSARDKLHPHVSRLLELHRSGRISIVLSPAAPLEAFLVMLSRGVRYDAVSRALRLMRDKLAEYRVNTYAPPSLEAAAFAAELRSRHPELTFFDSLHIAVAATLDIPLLTSDKTIAKVMGEEKLKHMDYREFL